LLNKRETKLESIEILTIGDEILQGQVVNTNATEIAAKLTDSGVDVGWMTTVGDNPEAILDAFARAKKRARAVIITGGLGPTPDDLTKPCLVQFFKDKLELREDLLAVVQKRFTSRGVPFPPQSQGQAEFPAKARVIPNPNGTAVGIHYSHDKVDWYSLPGVPLEMRAMMDDYILPHLAEICLADHVQVRLLRTTGIGESFLMGKLTNLSKASKLVEIAFLPRVTGVDLKLTARGKDLISKLDKAQRFLVPDIQSELYSIGPDNLPETVGRLAKVRGIKVAVAESCTGGLISKWFTDTPGSSDYFERGLVSYSNEAKNDFFSVRNSTIKLHGAVSEIVARTMAQSLLNRSLADLTCSVTGVAGPGGGTKDKPVGLVFIGVADRSGYVLVRRFQFWGDRDTIRWRAATAALKMMLDRLKEVAS
jgi:nicotinamide-nucleotide amidase